MRGLIPQRGCCFSGVLVSAMSALWKCLLRCWLGVAMVWLEAGHWVCWWFWGLLGEALL